MKYSKKWLDHWFEVKDLKELEQFQTMAGLEVESIEPVAPSFSGVVVAEVLSLEPHPNADRLKIAQVAVGSDLILQIVCGAPNVAVGVKVPCALDGARLPGDFAIKPTKMRGIDSMGMLCSSKELGLPDDGANGLLILSPDAPLGQDLRFYMNLDDYVIELKITPNRADCFSMLGLARDLSAVVGNSLQVPGDLLRFKDTQLNHEHDDSASVFLEAKEACPVYISRVLHHVITDRPTPLWMRQRLERSGLRSVSIVVDILNYVMLSLGQPMHAFDWEKVKNKEIYIRLAKHGECIYALNDQKLSLSEDDLVIADAEGPIALAGIIGDKNTSICKGKTSSILLESAHFVPEVIRGKSRRFGITSEASFRYERGVDPELPEWAMEYATSLIVDLCGAHVGKTKKYFGMQIKKSSILLRKNKVFKILGLELLASEIEGYLRALGCSLEQKSEGVWLVYPPSYRFDLSIEEDLVEELARLHGYDRIPVHLPSQAIEMQPVAHRLEDIVRYQMASLGYQEIVAYAFVSDVEEKMSCHSPSVRLKNPIAQHMTHMRTSLLGGLIEALVTNQKRKHNPIKLFETARIFLGENPAEQPLHLGGLAWGLRVPEQWDTSNEAIDFFDVKNSIQMIFSSLNFDWRAFRDHPAFHPGRCAAIYLDEKIIGFLGELHPKWVQHYNLSGAAPILFELSLEDCECRSASFQFQHVSKLPVVLRDLAFIVDDSLPFSSLSHALLKENIDCLLDVSLFDVYSGSNLPEGKKSLALRFTLRHPDRTLTDEDIQGIMQKIIVCSERYCGAYIRESI